MKILVVDDELVSRMKLQKILSARGECDAVEDGKTAIDSFEKALREETPFDLVTLDIVMPEMDGTEVLVELRELEKEFGIPQDQRAVIMMVTSHGEKDIIITSVSAGCDNYIVKPFDRKTIFEKLDSSRLKNRNFPAQRESPRETPVERTPRDVAMDAVNAVIAGFEIGEVNLPPLPQIGMKFNEMLRKGIDYKLLADLLKQDISISARLIKLSNSAHYGGLTKTRTLEQAISRLGLFATKQYVDALCSRAIYDGGSKRFKDIFEKLWEHSLCCAIACQIVSGTLKLTFPVDIFTAGLLHDVGKLVLLQGISAFEKSGKIKGKIDSAELTKAIDAHHCDFGASVLRKWNFSNENVQIALYHDNLDAVEAPLNELLVVYFANLLAKTILDGETAEPGAPVQEAESALLLGITPETFAEIEKQARSEMQSVGISFNLRTVEKGS